MPFTLTILGCSSAAPTSERNPSAQVLDTGKHVFLLDCAEGTQMQLRKLHIKMSSIERVFITHLHGDHFFGLIGLMTTWHLLGRKDKLHIYAVEELKEAIDVLLRVSQTTLLYPVEYHFIDPEQHKLVFEDPQISVFTIPLHHRMPTCGFLFQEKPKPYNINKKAIEGLTLSFKAIHDLKAGKNITLPDGRTVDFRELTLPPPRQLSYAYCTDTGYHEPIAAYLKGVDVLFHEATFMSNEAALAAEKLHSTAREAALIAQRSGVKQLIIGHFSSRYKELTELLNEAREVFPNTVLAKDGVIFKW